MATTRTLPTLLVAYRDLKQLGIPYSRSWLRRLIKDGAFPKPIMLSPHRPVWRLDADLQQWIASKSVVTSQQKEVGHVPLG